MNLFRKRLLPGVMALFLAVPALAQEDGLPIYLNTAYSFEERATDLVSRLTLEEKQSLLRRCTAFSPARTLPSAFRDRLPSRTA